MKEERSGSHYRLCGIADAISLAMREISVLCWRRTCTPWGRETREPAPAGVSPRRKRFLQCDWRITALSGHA